MAMKVTLVKYLTIIVSVPGIGNGISRSSSIGIGRNIGMDTSMSHDWPAIGVDAEFRAMLN